MSTSSSPAMNSVTNNGDQRKRKATDSDPLTDDQVNNDGGSGSSSLCCPCFHCQCGCHTSKAMEMLRMDAAAAYNLDSLPAGFRFNPTDKELIQDYLMRKIMNKNLPKNNIHEADVYGDSHPKDIVGNYAQAIEGEWYFFTSRNRKYRHGKRPSRSAGLGYWKATGSDKDIEDNGIKIGGKKSLVYYEGHQPNGTKTDWMMQEYVVEGYERQRFGLVDMKLDDYVLCKIYINKKGGKELKDEALDNELSLVANEDLYKYLTEVENVAVGEQPGLVSNQDMYPYPPIHRVENNVAVQHLQNLDQAIHHVENTNPANFLIENNVVVQQSNFGVHHHFDNNFPNQRVNPDVDDGVVMAYNQQACPSILQVENNVVVQNYQNLGFFDGQMTPYTMPTHAVPMMNFPTLGDPLEHHSSLARSNHIYALPDYPYLPPTPRKSAPPPPRIDIAQDHEQGRPGIYASVLAECSEYIELMIAKDGNLLLDDPHGYLSGAHEKLDAAEESKKHEAPKVEDSDESIKHEAPKAEESDESKKNEAPKAEESDEPKKNEAPKAEESDESKKNEAPKVEDSGNCGHQ